MRDSRGHDSLPFAMLFSVRVQFAVVLARVGAPASPPVAHATGACAVAVSAAESGACLGLVRKKLPRLSQRSLSSASVTDRVYGDKAGENKRNEGAGSTLQSACQGQA